MGNAINYPIKKEMEFITKLCSGKNAETKKLLNDILKTITDNNQGSFLYTKVKTMELAYLIIHCGVYLNNETINKKNDDYLIELLVAQNIKDINSILCSLIDSKINQLIFLQDTEHSTSLKKVITYIKENLNKKVTLKELSSIAGLNGPYLSCIFKKEIGENFVNYINRLRCERAAELIATTDMLFTDIMTKCGINDRSWFSKVFKHYMGIVPSKYRKRNKI